MLRKSISESGLQFELTEIAIQLKLSTGSILFANLNLFSFKLQVMKVSVGSVTDN